VNSAHDPGEPIRAVLEPNGMAVRRYRLLVREGDARTSAAERLRPTSALLEKLKCYAIPRNRLTVWPNEKEVKGKVASDS
jgi:hypothetical protein